MVLVSVVSESLVMLMLMVRVVGHGLRTVRRGVVISRMVVALILVLVVLVVLIRGILLLGSRGQHVHIHVHVQVQVFWLVRGRVVLLLIFLLLLIVLLLLLLVVARLSLRANKLWS